MANICDNTFFASSENQESLNVLAAFLEENLSVDFIDQSEDYLDLQFSSRWVFPCEVFEELLKEHKELSEDTTLYMRCLSTEYGCDYVSYRTYRDGAWDIRF